ncbi:hypothetical protein L1887_21007 [Cichorium endivia]|nr:hypothetical protein L1887_21007 [Cichorium endivia]
MCKFIQRLHNWVGLCKFGVFVECTLDHMDDGSASKFGMYMFTFQKINSPYKSCLPTTRWDSIPRSSNCDLVDDRSFRENCASISYNFRLLLKYLVRV